MTIVASLIALIVLVLAVLQLERTQRRAAPWPQPRPGSPTADDADLRRLRQELREARQWQEHHAAGAQRELGDAQPQRELRQSRQPELSGARQRPDLAGTRVERSYPVPGRAIARSIAASRTS